MNTPGKWIINRTNGDNIKCSRDQKHLKVKEINRGSLATILLWGNNMNSKWCKETWEIILSFNFIIQVKWNGEIELTPMQIMETFDILTHNSYPVSKCSKRRTMHQHPRQIWMGKAKQGLPRRRRKRRIWGIRSWSTNSQMMTSLSTINDRRLRCTRWTMVPIRSMYLPLTLISHRASCCFSRMAPISEMLVVSRWM